MDIIKQNITSKGRELAITELEEVLFLAAKITERVPGDKLPERLKALAREIEARLYERYGTEPQEYIDQLAKVMLFINPTHYVGQFAKIFRNKLLQGVYTPERLMQLDVSDMLPEVFLNPNASHADLLDIYQNISASIKNRSDDLRERLNSLLNPTARRKLHKYREEYKNKPILNKNAIDVTDLCENPYWKMKKVNMIICKQDNKFYCLDIQPLLAQLAKNNTCVNYFTGIELPQDIIANLLRRYSSEIDEIKAGNQVTVGNYTSDDIENLDKTLLSLRNLKKVLNKHKVKEFVLAFGLDPDIKEFASIPNMIKEALDELPYDEVTDALNTWIDDSIAEIMAIKTNGTLPTEHALASVPMTTVPIAKDLKPASPGKFKKAEEKFVEDIILQPNSIAVSVYEGYYINNLKNLADAATKKLIAAKTDEERQQLSKTLRDINTQLKETRKNGRSVKGLLVMINAYLAEQNKVLEKFKAKLGNNPIYPTQSGYTYQQMVALEKYIGDLNSEIGYIENAYKKFVDTQKVLGHL